MKYFACTFVLVILSSSAFGAPKEFGNNNIDNVDTNSDRFIKIAEHCASSEDIVSCLAVKGITALHRATRSNRIELIPGITFSRDSSASVRSGKSLSENEILSDLPKDTESRNGRLIDMAMQGLIDFFNTHNLQVTVPKETTQELARTIDEARNKKKKIMGPLMMAIGAKLLAIIPLVLGGLAFLAIKAVIVAKIAFLLAIALGASKLFGAGGLGKFGGGGGLGGGLGGGYNNGWSQAGTGGWSSGAQTQYPYARSIDEVHDLAYNGQAPSVKS